MSGTGLSRGAFYCYPVLKADIGWILFLLSGRKRGFGVDLKSSRSLTNSGSAVALLCGAAMWRCYVALLSGAAMWRCYVARK